MHLGATQKRDAYCLFQTGRPELALFWCFVSLAFTSASVWAESWGDVIANSDNNHTAVEINQQNNETQLITEEMALANKEVLAAYEAQTKLQQARLKYQATVDKDRAALANTIVKNQSDLEGQRIELENKREQRNFDAYYRFLDLEMQRRQEALNYQQRLIEASAQFGPRPAHVFDSSKGLVVSRIEAPERLLGALSLAVATARRSQVAAWPGVTTFASPLVQGSRPGFRQRSGLTFRVARIGTPHAIAGAPAFLNRSETSILGSHSLARGEGESGKHPFR